MTHALKDVLKKYAEDKKAPEVTKLPAEPPKPPNGVSEAMRHDEAQWPVNLYLNHKQAPFIEKMKGGDEAVLMIRVKANNVTSSETTSAGGKPEKRCSADLTILEVAKLQ